jgi:hypothetical protein
MRFEHKSAVFGCLLLGALSVGASLAWAAPAGRAVAGCERITGLRIGQRVHHLTLADQAALRVQIKAFTSDCRVVVRGAIDEYTVAREQLASEVLGCAGGYCPGQRFQHGGHWAQVEQILRSPRGTFVKYDSSAIFAVPGTQLAGKLGRQVAGHGRKARPAKRRR